MKKTTTTKKRGPKKYEITVFASKTVYVTANSDEEAVNKVQPKIANANGKTKYDSFVCHSRPARKSKKSFADEIVDSLPLIF